MLYVRFIGGDLLNQTVRPRAPFRQLLWEAKVTVPTWRDR